MGPVDIALAAAILAGAGWILYKSLWKKKDHCGGCCGGGGCGK